jgi:hypothetical protein
MHSPLLKNIVQKIDPGYREGFGENAPPELLEDCVAMKFE